LVDKISINSGLGVDKTPFNNGLKVDKTYEFTVKEELIE